MKKVPELKTDRLVLRNIAMEDTPHLVKWRSNPDVYRYFLNPHPLTKEEHEKWFAEKYTSDRTRFDWMALSPSEEPVGVFGLKKENEDATEAEISYLLAPEQYGKGYAAEAVNRLMEYCRDDWNCKSVLAIVNEENKDSVRFIEKQGFEKESTDGVFAIYKREL